MSKQGILGYFAGKNGVGIRIFINRASSSIGRRVSEGQKNLRLIRTSFVEPRTSNGDTPFKDSFADLEILDTDTNPSPPKNGADKERVDKTASDRNDKAFQTFPMPRLQAVDIQPGAKDLTRVEEVVMRLKAELEPSMQRAARAAAAQEHERTREWLENRGLPKVARVAQHETYNVLRSAASLEPSPRSAAAATRRPNRINFQARRSVIWPELASRCLRVRGSQSSGRFRR
jgi:hypothetical protein